MAKSWNAIEPLWTREAGERPYCVVGRGELPLENLRFLSPIPKEDLVMQRPSWQEYFTEITRLVASRSTCTRRKVGSILVKNKRILATGYNGAPSGVPHCLDVGCLREEMGIPSGERHELCRGLHAEQNAILQAAHYGVSIDGADIYCTNLPCVICTKMIINAGIRRVYYLAGYADPLSREMFRTAAIDLVPLQPPTTPEEGPAGDG